MELAVPTFLFHVLLNCYVWLCATSLLAPFDIVHKIIVLPLCLLSNPRAGQCWAGGPRWRQEMPEENHTAVTEFVLLGFTDRREVKFPLFGLFLLIYVTTLGGNAGLIVLVQLNASLHTPMYYFLSNLSFLDLSYASAIAPKLLVNLVAQRTTISFFGCATQMFLFAALADAECFLLAVMAYDRYVAICQPLLRCHVAPGLRLHGSRGLSQRGPDLAGAHIFHVHPVLLWLQHHQPLLLRHSPTAGALLLQHHGQRGASHHLVWLHTNQLLPGHCYLLRLHPGHHSPTPRGRGQAQGLLLLHLSPHGCWALL